MFKEVENHKDYYRVMENGKYGVGIYPVLYGFRIRVWELNSPVCTCDLCFGDSPTHITIGYTVIKSFIENGGNPNDIPYQEVKPYPKKDCLFTDWMTEQLKSGYIKTDDYVSITTRELKNYKMLDLNKLL